MTAAHGPCASPSIRPPIGDATGDRSLPMDEAPVSAPRSLPHLRALLSAAHSTAHRSQRGRSRSRSRGWPNSCVDRLIGSIRRECLDHVIVFHEASFADVSWPAYFTYYHRWRTHLSLAMDCPEPRSRPCLLGSGCRVIAVPEVSGLHHHYERRGSIAMRAPNALISFGYGYSGTTGMPTCQTPAPACSTGTSPWMSRGLCTVPRRLVMAGPLLVMTMLAPNPFPPSQDLGVSDLASGRLRRGAAAIEPTGRQRQPSTRGGDSKSLIVNTPVLFRLGRSAPRGEQTPPLAPCASSIYERLPVCVRAACPRSCSSPSTCHPSPDAPCRCRPSAPRRCACRGAQLLSGTQRPGVDDRRRAACRALRDLATHGVVQAAVVTPASAARRSSRSSP